ncbi:hypothetical protein HDU67_005498 [Dinochytrium kinnereticum]|nr:hypothetical protein HDU67_005498 [Dinochytrium kinnereticum]
MHAIKGVERWNGVIVPDPAENLALVRFGLGIGAYLIGCVVYVGKLPESLFPGKFDLFFHSHQIWHVLCIAAALFHVNVVLDFVEWRNTATCTL